MKLIKCILESYLFLTKLIKIVLYNYFKLDISLVFIDNQIYTS